MPLTPVDRLEIQVLVDNVTDNLSSVSPFVTREWAMLQRRGMRFGTGGSLCCANHGLSLVITAHGPNGTTRTMLLDGGPVDYAVERNSVRLGIDFGSIEAVMLSHGHWDHAGGLPRALGMIQTANGGKAVPLYLHPEMFHELGLRQSDGGVLPTESVPSPQQWRDFGAEPVVTDAPLTLLDDMFFVSGEIPRITTYEKGLVEQVRRTADDPTWRADPLVIDERILIVHLRDKGLVVFSACSHAGIINALHLARASFPDVKMHAAIGGFHLAGVTEQNIPETVHDLGGFGLDLMIVGHCTGWRGINALVTAFGEQVVVPAAVGKFFSLNADAALMPTPARSSSPS